MHILLTDSSSANILEFRKPLVEGLLSDGHSVTILVALDKHAQALEEMGCDLVHLNIWDGRLGPKSAFWLAWDFRKHFRRLAPDCILSSAIKTNIFGAFAAKKEKIAFIPNVSNLGITLLSGGILQRVTMLLYRFAFQSLPTVIFQSRDDRAFFIEHSIVKRSQTMLLPGAGIDLGAFGTSPLPPAEEPITFVMISRLLRNSGVNEFVEAARAFFGRANTKFILYGDYNLEHRNAIPPSEVDGWVRAGILSYVRTTDDVRPLIEHAHCVVLPAHCDGSNSTLIEAAALGRPLIAPDGPGCRDFVDDGANGYLCEARNSQSLIEAFARFVHTDCQKKDDMGRASRGKIQREYSVEIVVAKYRGLLLCHLEN